MPPIGTPAISLGRAAIAEAAMMAHAAPAELRDGVSVGLRAKFNLMMFVVAMRERLAALIPAERNRSAFLNRLG